ncbi:MAG: riboflavin synthase [Verrucomicrobiae bacterium]|nr:riboflavin synthase [Verrucomicrobiae bacterium]
MFSGIVAGQGLLESIRPGRKSIRVRIRHLGLAREAKTGSSVAVNGCCLTVVENRGGLLEFDVLRETWKRTVFHRAKPPERINLETSLKLGDTLGGHFVTGHIDGIGRLVARRTKGADLYIEIAPPRGFMRWIVMKGCVALDGVSLTVSSVSSARFGIWLIPHTLEITTLGWKCVGDFVNLEADMLAKYAWKALGEKVRRT